MIARERRGLGLMLASFAACPCHLPVTLGVLATVFGGTWLGTTITAQPVLAGAIITLVWALGTWRGLRLLRKPVACPVRPQTRQPMPSTPTAQSPTAASDPPLTHIA